MVRAVNRIMLSVAAINTPTPNDHSNSVLRIQRSWISGCVSDIGSAHGTAWNEHEDVDQQITGYEQCDRRAREDCGAKRNGAHHARKGRLIDAVSNLRIQIGPGWLFNLHGLPP
jgi:hypothetical protein